MVNNTTLIGRLGKDAEILTAQGITRLSVATTHSWKDKTSGEWKEETTWHRVTHFREKNIPKGALVYIEGRISHREYEGKWYTEIIAHTVRHLDRQKDSTHMPAVPAEALTSEESTDDLPF